VLTDNPRDKPPRRRSADTAPRRRQADAAEEEQIRQRVRTLLDRYSQAEIARRTGVLPSRVSRYLNDTAIPAVFCRRLIKEFDVNPAWLLTGEGAPYLSDVTESTGQLAGNLLEVVNALNAVSQLRIGSLGGKQHARMLRELGDAMARHDVLHRKLNTQSVPILKQVLHDLQNSLDSVDINQRHLFDKSKLAPARGLCRTAEQLARFCDDPWLRFEFALLQGRLATYEDDLPGVLESTQRAILLAAGRSEFANERALVTLGESVGALQAQRRFAEARRMAESALAAAKPEMRTSPPALQLAAMVADIQVSTGELRAGTDTLMRVRSLMTGKARLHADAYMASALLFSGAVEVPEAANIGAYHLAQAARVLWVSLMLEDESALEHAIAYWDNRPEIQSWERHYAGLLLRALQKDGGTLPAEIRSLINTSPQPMTPPKGSFLYHYNRHMIAVYGAQSYRLIGKTAEARRYFTEAARAIADLPDWYCLTVGWQALHHRNALELGNNNAQRKARDFFDRHIELGYRAFTPLAEAV
jgi:transcriptional regulator with XRE-family HTH domain